MGKLSAVILAGMLMVGCGGNPDGQGTALDEEPPSTAAATADAPGDSDLSKPRVASRYQGSIDRAWQAAVNGENPAGRCAALKGSTLLVFRGDDDEAKQGAREAVEACSVTVSARYFLTYIEEIIEGERTCRDLLTETAVNIGAMITTVGEESDAVRKARRARLLDAIAPQVREVCPELARAIL